LSTLKKYLYNLLFIVSNILFPMLTFAYAARVLGPAGIGKVQVVMSFAQYFVMIAALGIPTYGIREVARVAGDQKKLSELFSELLTINLITTILLAIVYYILIFTIGWFQSDLPLFCLAGAIVLSGFLTIDWFYNGSEFFRHLSLRSVLIKTLSLIALILFVKTPQDLLIYLLINILTVLVANLWNLFSLPVKLKIHFRNLELKKHIPGLSVLFATTIAISIYTLADTLLIRFLADDQTVGLYTAAIKINKIIVPVIAALGMVLIPKLTRSIETGDTTSLNTMAGQSFAYICLLGVPVSAGLLIFAPEIMLVFSGSGFISAIPAMQITAGLALIIGLGHLFGLQLLIPGGYEKKYLVATMAGMVVSIMINLLLIPNYGESGAAIAMILSEIAVTLVCFVYVRKYFTLKFNWIQIFQAVIASLFFIPIAVLLRNAIAEPALRLTFAVLTCILIYFAFQILVFRDKQVRGVVTLVFNNWLH